MQLPANNSAMKPSLNLLSKKQCDVVSSVPARLSAALIGRPSPRGVVVSDRDAVLMIFLAASVSLLSKD